MEAVFFSFASGVDNLVDCAEQKGVFDVLIQRILCGIAKNSIWEYNKLNGWRLLHEKYFLENLTKQNIEFRLSLSIKIALEN